MRVAIQLAILLLSIFPREFKKIHISTHKKKNMFIVTVTLFIIAEK